MKRYLFIICLIVNLLISFLIPFNNSYTLSYKDTITSIIEIDINQTYIPVPNTKTLEIEIPSKLSFQSYYFSLIIDRTFIEKGWLTAQVTSANLAMRLISD